MSLSQPSDAWADSSTLCAIGYGLAGVGVLAAVMRLVQPGPVWASVLLLTALASLVVILRAPETFETRWRGGGRGLNPLAGAPAFLLFAIGLTDQLDDITLPAAGAAVGAALLLMASTRSLGRPGLSSPLMFQIVAALLGAAIGYGALVALDVDYDASPPAVLPAPVLDKYTTSSRSGLRYHLRVPPFGARRAVSSLNVSRVTYDALRRGGQVCVLEHRGAIGLSWASVRLC